MRCRCLRSEGNTGKNSSGYRTYRDSIVQEIGCYEVAHRNYLMLCLDCQDATNEKTRTIDHTFLSTYFVFRYRSIREGVEDRTNLSIYPNMQSVYIRSGIPLWYNLWIVAWREENCTVPPMEYRRI
jgi:hypothetical protein